MFQTTCNRVTWDCWCVLIPYESGSVSDFVSWLLSVLYLRLNPLRIRECFRLRKVTNIKLIVRLNPLRIRECFRLRKIASSLIVISLNPLRIRECFRQLTLRNKIMNTVLIPYESGSVSDCDTNKYSKHSLSLNPLRIRECFRLYSLWCSYTLHVLIPYESGSVSDTPHVPGNLPGRTS